MVSPIDLDSKSLKEPPTTLAKIVMYHNVGMKVLYINLRKKTTKYNKKPYALEKDEHRKLE